MKTYLPRIIAAASIASALSAANAAGCLNPASWNSVEQSPPAAVTASNVIADMAKRDVVLLGEFHDEDDHHRWQLQTLAALQVLRPNMVIGFEMFPRRVQPVLDRWVSGELTLKQFLELVEWDKVWNTSPDLYVPLFQFARINRIPMVAMNVDNALNKAVREKGWDQVPETLREGVGRAAPPSDAYRDFLFEVYRGHAGVHGAKGSKPAKSDAGFRNFVESQTTWDRAMAEALAKPVLAAQGEDKPLAIGILGSGHAQYGYGVPHQLRDLGVKNIGILIATPSSTECKNIRPGMASAVFALPGQAEDKPVPPRLGVRLEEDDGGIRLVDVTAGSLADRTGLKAGDRLLEVGGTPPISASQVASSVRRQPSGTWLPVKIKRGEEMLDFVVKFPVKQ
ncbi:PDZ domain-containing protein [Herbaspirillum sp. HC18]|nr:PDZ domain-containing protein [Herbaspirillum sp. HC18]